VVSRHLAANQIQSRDWNFRTPELRDMLVDAVTFSSTSA